MKILLIVPHVGRKNLLKKKEYVHTWQMEPTMLAALAAITPSDIEVEMIDERLGEDIEYDRKDVDAVAITAETYTAKRAYEICEGFRSNNIPTIVGGWQAMLIPEEVALYADTVCVGYAEAYWLEVMDDLRAGKLKTLYGRKGATKQTSFVVPKRSIYADRPYFGLSCIETGRGCPLTCNFCSITAATNATYAPRPQSETILDMKTVDHKSVFLVEDNFFGNMKHAKNLLRQMVGLGMRWVGQGTLALAYDDEVLELMQASGCIGILIGFESFKADTLTEMDKPFNIGMLKFGTYQEMIKRIHKYNIAIYGTFIFGYDTDTVSDFRTTTEQAIDYGIAIAAFNHLLPFPGTPMYRKFKEEGRLIDDPWWLSPIYRYGDIPYQPLNMSRETLHEECLRAKERFYSVPSIFQRAATNVRGNFHSFQKAGVYAGLNYMLRKEVKEKDGLPLGNLPRPPQPKEVNLNGHIQISAI
jgi:radical SAM superfamily enzyme YgiQ (UPF0313 family)